MTSEKWTLLFVNLVLGAVLIYSYYHYITKGGVSVKTLWGKAYSVRNFYTLSLILCVVSYLVMSLFILFKTPNSRQNLALISNLVVINVLIITISMLWLPLTLLYVKEKDSKSLTMLGVLLVLFIVAMSAYKQVNLVKALSPENNNCAQTMKTAAIVGAGYFFFHTFFLDFLGWSYGFFSK